ncbi:DUF192 domain-containing protein [Costertonia aggregata]|uniref:DUF192 domain-containing protein n=1 Tax=Costertonia aggregata TaxID=343403 RepID=A0A7H9AS60_9FLAO|nr:DUF192 domain-containing protein [Costertonia aggregata]QLG46182.1 DUF192 domain-containing protein [Costertonia aggregata]
MKNIFKIVAFSLVYVFVLQSCSEKAKKVIKTEPIVFEKEGKLYIYQKETDSLLTTLDIEIAESEYETQTGLMYRESIEDYQGMLFVFSDEQMHAFYMKNTQFPLDIIYIKADSTIASFQKNAQPFNENSLSSQVPVQYVLEVNAGLAEKWGLEVGDKVNFSKH